MMLTEGQYSTKISPLTREAMTEGRKSSMRMSFSNLSQLNCVSGPSRDLRGDNILYKGIGDKGTLRTSFPSVMTNTPVPANNSRAFERKGSLVKRTVLLGLGRYPKPGPWRVNSSHQPLTTSFVPAAVASSACHTCVEPLLLKMLIKGIVATAHMAMANLSP